MSSIRNQQKTASYFVIGMVMWEFFSYYGMQALLILYLTQYLHFPDARAYAIYGAFTSLIYVTPIIGGWLADRYCGYRYATLWGCALIMCGHLMLGLSVHGLFIGLTLLILGIGFFKSNAICLIGDCYPNDNAGRSVAFAWYYVSGNLGAVGSQLLCPYLAQHIGWYAGFIAAAVGMFFGLLMLFCSRRYFKWYKNNVPESPWKNFHPCKRLGIAASVVALSFGLIYLILTKLLVGDLLLLVTGIGLLMYLSIYKTATPAQKKSLRTIAVLTVFACGFWIFDQQGSSSISLFISRYINRTVNGFTIPAGSFQAINPGIILVFGAFMAWVWRYLDRKGFRPSPSSKVSVALLFLIVGFFLIAEAASIAGHQQLAPMIYPVSGLMIIGAAEMFVDPILLATITAAAPAHSEGRLVALYYLATGAIANFVAGKVADLTIDPTQNTATAFTYHEAYLQILYVSCFMLAALLFLKCVSRWHRR